MNWQTSDTIATLAAFISLVSFAFSYYQYRRAKHDEMIRALQGEKEAVAYIAYQLSQGKLPKNTKLRAEILMSLCLAAVFERSDRSRTLIYAALKNLQELHSDEVVAKIAYIESNFNQFRGIVDLDRGLRRLRSLKQALGIAQDGFEGHE